eukprot:988198-Amphidinium_carterae.3
MTKTGVPVEVDLVDAMIQQKPGVKVSGNWARQFLVCLGFTYKQVDSVSGKKNFTPSEKKPLIGNALLIESS